MHRLLSYTGRVATALALVVTGTAGAVWGGSAAGRFLLPARTGAGDGDAVRWCVVERDDVEVRALPGFDPTSRITEVRIDGLRVPDDRWLRLPAERGGPDELLAHHRGLEVALARQRDVLEVAPPAQPRTGIGARRLDALGGRYVDPDGVAAPEAVAVGALGDLDHHPLPGQGVAHEHDPGLGLGEPRHAVPAVRHRSDLDRPDPLV